jgi:hypothetical protein
MSPDYGLERHVGDTSDALKAPTIRSYVLHAPGGFCPTRNNLPAEAVVFHVRNSQARLNT